jgi:hypothetical protein
MWQPPVASVMTVAVVVVVASSPQQPEIHRHPINPVFLAKSLFLL